MPYYRAIPGFNSEPTGPVRAATIKRWISMAAAQQCDVDALVRPTEIEHVGIMRYEANIWQTAGIPGPLAVPPIPDQEILSPGDYVCIPRILSGKGKHLMHDPCSSNVGLTCPAFQEPSTPCLIILKRDSHWLMSNVILNTLCSYGSSTICPSMV